MVGGIDVARHDGVHPSASRCGCIWTSASSKGLFFWWCMVLFSWEGGTADRPRSARPSAHTSSTADIGRTRRTAKEATAFSSSCIISVADWNLFPTCARGPASSSGQGVSWQEDSRVDAA
ncbi:hypothetical protein E4K10_44270 [Streptomyces sp. T1317-0309]|nr:hypothetical protein E4K10_44270 [Streptomyces sp. T1317-0309]